MKITTDRTRAISLSLICLLFVALSGIYSVTTPIFEALDELWHYPVVKNIADGSGLPILRPGDPGNYWQQEGGQPPLYYILGAAATSWIDTGKIDDLYHLNPHAATGVPNSYDNKNMVLHSDAENFPYHGVSLAVHLIRLLSILMGLGTVLITYALARELIPGDDAVALGAAMFITVIPEFLFVSGSINNDNLINLLASAALLVIVRAVKRGLDPRSAVILSILIGLAVLSKVSGLGLIGLVVLAGLADALTRKSLRPLLSWTLPAVGATALIAGWWFARNWLLYGDALAFDVWLRMVPKRPAGEGILQVIFSEFAGFKLSFWGVFGGFNVLADGVIYRFYDVITVLALVGLIVGLVRNRRAQFRQVVPVLICAAWIAVLGVALLRWTQMTLASQARLMFPGISVFAVAFAFGLRSLPPRRLQPVIAACIGIPMLVAAALIPFRSIAPAYPRPTIVSEGSIPASVQPLDVNYAGKIELLGYHLAQKKMRPGDELDITLYWKALAPMDTDYSVFVHLFGRDDEMIGQSDSLPSGGAYATRQAKPGQVIVDRHRIRVSAKALAPSAIRVEAGIYSLPDFTRLNATDPSGTKIGTSPLVTLVKLAGDALDGHDRMVSLGSFEDKISLVGFQVPERQVAPGGVLTGGLTWRDESAGLENYTVFVQLVGNNGLAAQYDSQPLRGYYPTSLWEPGELIDDPFQLKVGPDIKNGDYDLIAGLYSLKTGARLMVGGNTFVKLARITVRGSR